MNVGGSTGSDTAIPEGAPAWSPDGRAIAFWRFDTTGVGQFSLINDTDTPVEITPLRITSSLMP